MTEFEWRPDTFLAVMHAEIADYDGLQGSLVDASRDLDVRRVLDLGCGSGETARRVLAAHPEAELVGLDASADMLAAAASGIDPAATTWLRQRLEDPLPDGPYDLVVSALAVHHLPGPAKAALFGRVAQVLAPGGRFVLADLVVPEDPADSFTFIDWVEDVPSTAAEQLSWLGEAGLSARVSWRCKDLATLVADRHHGE